MPPESVDLSSDGVGVTFDTVTGSFRKFKITSNTTRETEWWSRKNKRHCYFATQKKIKKKKKKRKEKSWGILTVHLRSGLTFLMIPWKAWDNGPWPKSWQRPATWTHRTSLPVILKSGCLIRSEQTSSPAKWHTLKRTATFISPMYGLGSWSAAIMHWSALYLQPNSILNRPP